MNHCIVFENGAQCIYQAELAVPGIGMVCRYHGRNGRPVSPPSLEQYRKMVSPDKELCRWCNAQLPQTLDQYQHPGGWPVAGFTELQWLYLRCPACDYDWSLWKLGVPRYAGLEV